MSQFPSQRQLEAELMDDPLLAARAHERALRGLHRLNTANRIAAIVWRPVAAIAQAHPDHQLKLLDVACGGGDLAIGLSRQARRRRVALTVEGCDISKNAVNFAHAAAVRANESVRFFRADALADDLIDHYDIITCSRFLHHLTHAQAIQLLRTFAANADHAIVSDLIRNRIGYFLTWSGTRLLSRSGIVRADGPRSVRAALTIPEARELARRAGLDNARFQHRWLARFRMIWHRDGSTETGET